MNIPILYPLFQRLCYVFLASSLALQAADEPNRLYLSGKDSADPVLWNFQIDGGNRAGEQAKIPVPANWETQGFGTYTYRSISDEIGTYERTFTVPEAWEHDRLFIHFEGVAADTEIYINGEIAGPAFQGSFYPFEYEITHLVKPYPVENDLKVVVRKKPRDETLSGEIGDYWVFGGIYRPVYLETRPEVYLERVQLDATSDGQFKAIAYLDKAASTDASLTCVIYDADGKEVTNDSFPIEGDQVTMLLDVESPQLWSDESPYLYTAEFILEGATEKAHSLERRFGFRTFEFRPGEGFFVNGKRVFFRGVNRHSIDPQSGRSLSREENYNQARLILSMNANAVRMHYPADPTFMDACDELGIYFLDELCASWKDMSTDRGNILVKALVDRDQHRPSVFAWANGNEGGWNRDHDVLFTEYDIQDRPVVHPKSRYEHLSTPHYPSYDTVLKSTRGKRNVTFFTEALHAHYDGGGGAGMEDYWDAITESRNGAGLFLWALWDEGVERVDLSGRIETSRKSVDGVVGPYYEKEGSFYAIREIWSPLQLQFSEPFDGSVAVKNEYYSKNPQDHAISWILQKWDAQGQILEVASGAAPSLNLEPGKETTAPLNLPLNWADFDALTLRVKDESGKLLTERTIPLQSPQQMTSQVLAEKSTSPDLKVDETNGTLSVQTKEVTWQFDLANGQLKGASRGNYSLPLSEGPRILRQQARSYDMDKIQFKKENPDAKYELEIPAEEDHALDAIKHVSHDRHQGTYRISVEGEDFSWTWLVHPQGVLELKVTYAAEGKMDFHGIAFDLPEEQMTGRQWMGQGPYRVWKNRPHSAQFGVWQTDYNSTETGIYDHLEPGEKLTLPEFRGIFGDLYWARLMLEDGTLLVSTSSPDLALHQYPVDGPASRTMYPLSPRADLAFLKAIPPMGSKYHGAWAKGPKSEPANAEGTYAINLWFAWE